MKHDKQVIKWGFDLTEFPSAKTFKNLVKKHKLKNGKKHRHKKLGYNLYDFHWQNPSLVLETENNAITGKFSERKYHRPVEKGFAGYIGITGERKPVLRLVKDIKRKAAYIKGESKYARDFI